MHALKPPGRAIGGGVGRIGALLEVSQAGRRQGERRSRLVHSRLKELAAGRFMDGNPVSHCCSVVYQRTAGAINGPAGPAVGSVVH